MNEISKKLESHYQFIAVLEDLISDSEREVMRSVQHLVGRRVKVNDSTGTVHGIYKGHYTNETMYIGLRITMDNGNVVNLVHNVVEFIDE